MEYIYIGIGGFFGAILRYIVSSYYQSILHTVFPIETFFINIFGSFLLSYISNLTLEEFKVNFNIRLAITTGFIGAFTTFSTFTKETMDLLRNGRIAVALIYVLLSILVGFIMSFIGFELGDKTAKILQGREEN
ncbi:fluoride efflux transporter CrcB [Thermoanaerobacterium thermosaccharolyticum]|jgi:CrcB protein|uniref:Fluoride-specific ion channel FluC n=1 Tax=Thermoanaerobacterium thermosaccharolyticum (strain ATCC 7956 / DSM 571 / NCIMB 9385 / NCA 3814 / NCTC 13789 / WDCM 00135 / 2032) TaxID=580327 RepID=D9TMW7_THETC|nr:fluoride efflux transporter CrcB [Thermoanaerobacterium thermosaccharolyticum]ADL67645.1 CrcB protein [Thermoanaerobacterium thermosaccharolyticum DSM 571]KAA5806493.1 fluoride efflux transporter CrcB [Thermoanaerobacterium thermosaccharolyticum]MCP2240739.1 CrcB protein [Thermoanaerobacterium thermosaccharolyticum]TCW32526.1 CrcB protein [Thermohydrogenium kirishiense]